MACKNCTKSEIANWFTNLLKVTVIASLPTSFTGLLVVWVQSWDDEGYYRDETVVHYMNWVLFSIFAGILLLAVTTVISYHNPPKQIQDN